MLFANYFQDWIELYKKGAVSPVTYEKYKGTLKSLRAIAPTITLQDVSKREYQKILNSYAETHAKQTVKDFHTHLKAAIIDAIDEGIIAANPCRKVELKGCAQKKTPPKYLSAAEAARLMSVLDVDASKWDLLILICLKTGLRFAEAVGLTVDSFDFNEATIAVNQTYDYKITQSIILETKTKSSKRKIVIDNDLCKLIKKHIVNIPSGVSIFAVDRKHIFSGYAIKRLRVLCKKADTPPIGIHGLRHTHASILFSNGVSLNSISRRLGHAKPSITQDTYLHIIKELEDADNEKIMGALTSISAVST